MQDNAQIHEYETARGGGGSHKDGHKGSDKYPESNGMRNPSDSGWVPICFSCGKKGHKVNS